MTHTATTDKSTRCERALYIAFDMGRDAWQLASSDGGKTRREVKLARTDVERGKADVLAEIAKARAAFGLPEDAPVHALYEAGRDGFWFARWLLGQSVQCLVVDPCSILVDRKAKQRKNDAIDSRALLDLLVRHVTGDRTVNTVAVPPPDAEDARELGRLIHRLGRARRSLALRVQSVLWSRGVDASYHTGIRAEFDKMRTGDGRPLDRVVRVELDVLCGQIEHLDRDLDLLERERVAQVEEPVTPVQAQAQQLEQLLGIGPIGAWTLAHEMFGWRTFRNGKALGAFLGLAPTPWCSGQMNRDQGISKAGPAKLRALLVQLGWGWLRYQPQSALAKWYGERFGGTAKRSKRVGIVAVARKLAVALWRYVTQGVIPDGAAFKSAGHRVATPHQRGFCARKLPPLVPQQAVAA
jgi:transposase